MVLVISWPAQWQILFCHCLQHCFCGHQLSKNFSLLYPIITRLQLFSLLRWTDWLSMFCIPSTSVITSKLSTSFLLFCYTNVQTKTTWNNHETTWNVHMFFQLLPYHPECMGNGVCVCVEGRWGERGTGQRSECCNLKPGCSSSPTWTFSV